MEKHSEGNGKDEETPQRAAAREADEEGVYHIFALFENLVGLDPTGVSTVLVRNATLWTNISALLRQGSEHYLAKSKGKTRRTEAFSQNEAYAAELLAVVVQAATSPSSLQEQREANEEEPSALAVAGTQRGGTNSLLESLSAFLRSPPQTDDETEVMQNLFDALCALLSEDLNRDEFVRLEGPELVVLLLSYAAGKHDTHKGPKHVSKRGVLLVKKSALRLLAYALGGQGAGTQRTAQAFVSAGGLKPLLALLGTVGKVCVLLSVFFTFCVSSLHGGTRMGLLANGRMRRMNAQVCRSRINLVYADAKHPLGLGTWVGHGCVCISLRVLFAHVSIHVPESKRLFNHPQRCGRRAPAFHYGRTAQPAATRKRSTYPSPRQVHRARVREH